MVFRFLFTKFKTTNDRFGGGVNYQMQIVTIKLTNGKYPNLPTTNDQFWVGGGG